MVIRLKRVIEESTDFPVLEKLELDVQASTEYNN